MFRNLGFIVELSLLNGTLGEETVRRLKASDMNEIGRYSYISPTYGPCQYMTHPLHTPH